MLRRTEQFRVWLSVPLTLGLIVGAGSCAEAKVRILGGPVQAASGGRYYPSGGMTQQTWKIGSQSGRSVPEHRINHARQEIETPKRSSYVPWGQIPAFSPQSIYLIHYKWGEFSQPAGN